MHGMQARARSWRRRESTALLSALEAAAGGGGGGGGGAGAVALGHHADDQAETVLLKLLRGCHLSNVEVRAFIEPRI